MNWLTSPLLPQLTQESQHIQKVMNQLLEYGGTTMLNTFWALTPLVFQVALRSPEKIKNFLQLLYKAGMAAVDAVTQEQEARVTQKAVYYQKL